MNKKILILLIFLITFTPSIVHLFNGISSGLTPVFFILPIAVLYLTQSVILSLISISLIIFQIVYFFFGIIHPAPPQFNYHISFYNQTLITSLIITAAAIRLAYLFYKKVDQINEELIATKQLKSISILSNGLAHEVNNPLAIIAIKNSLILRSAKENNIEEIVPSQINGIDLAIERILKIIDKLEIVASINLTHGKTEIELKDFFEKLLQERKDISELLDEKNNLKQIPPLTIKAPRDLLQQAFNELFDNAKYAALKSKKPWIRLSVKSKDNQAVISIANSGPAVSTEIQNKIFEAFFTTKDIGVGLGLGLNIARAIIEMNQGTIQYISRSETPQFEIRLPLKNDE